MDTAQEVERLVSTKRKLNDGRVVPRNVLQWNRRERLEDEKKMHEEQLKNPFVQDKGPALRSIQNIDRLLRDQAPEPTVPGSVRDALKAERDRLREKIRQGMPTKEQMRRCGPNDVYEHMNWERVNKPDILRYKNVCRQLEPDNPNNDLANIEAFRPEMGTARTSGLQTDAIVSGHMGYQSHAAQENWPLDPPANTALEQTKRAQPAAKKMRRALTEAEKQAKRENLARAREAKRQKALAAQETAV